MEAADIPVPEVSPRGLNLHRGTLDSKISTFFMGCIRHRVDTNLKTLGVLRMILGSSSSLGTPVAAGDPDDDGDGDGEWEGDVGDEAMESEAEMEDDPILPEDGV